MSTTTARTKRSASMPLPGASKGRDPSPAPAPGGRARLLDEKARQLRELFLRFDLDGDGSSPSWSWRRSSAPWAFAPPPGTRSTRSSPPWTPTATAPWSSTSSPPPLATLLLGPAAPPWRYRTLKIGVKNTVLASSFTFFFLSGVLRAKSVWERRAGTQPKNGTNELPMRTVSYVTNETKDRNEPCVPLVK
ncbi:unnamed protein product [Miscanthus lutarioriparius]|uniref:Uncharacterized protein n=1 Tax=Miscanthus lutarioriparius TaxID=422564 RepID=A0A811NU78_9POAL|nr:unnamed protein product [Miscanthus lutarioriparius]